LRDEEEYGDFDDDEFAKLGNDAERNDESGGSSGRVTDAKKDHEGPSRGEGKSSGEDLRPEDAGVGAERLCAGSG